MKCICRVADRNVADRRREAAEWGMSVLWQDAVGMALPLGLVVAKCFMSAHTRV